MAKWCRRNHFEPCDYLFSCCGRSVSSNDCSVWLVAVFCVILPLFGVVFHSCCCCFVFLTTTETGNMRYSPFFLFLSAFDSPTWFDCCLFVGSGPFWWRMTLFWRRVAVFGARRHVVVVFGGSFLSASFSFRSFLLLTARRGLIVVSLSDRGPFGGVWRCFGDGWPFLVHGVTSSSFLVVPFSPPPSLSDPPSFSFPPFSRFLRNWLIVSSGRFFCWSLCFGWCCFGWWWWWRHFSVLFSSSNFRRGWLEVGETSFSSCKFVLPNYPPWSPKNSI